MITYGFPFCRNFWYTLNKLNEYLKTEDITISNLLTAFLITIRALNVKQDKKIETLQETISKLLREKRDIFRDSSSVTIDDVVKMIFILGEGNKWIKDNVKEILLSNLSQVLESSSIMGLLDDSCLNLLQSLIVKLKNNEEFEPAEEPDVAVDCNHTKIAAAMYAVTGYEKYLDIIKENTAITDPLQTWESVFFLNLLFPTRKEQIIRAFNSHKNLEILDDFLAIISWISGFIEHGLYDLFLEAPEFKVPKISEPLDYLEDEFKDSIIISRSQTDHETYGCHGLIYVGKCIEPRNFGRKVLIDAVDSHRIFICGKTGSGKSYTAGVILEELAMSGLNIGAVIFDPAGTFYDINQEPTDEKHLNLLRKWGLSPISFTKVTVFVPVSIYKALTLEHKKFSKPFSISPADLDLDDWCHTFNIDPIKSPQADLLNKVIKLIRKGYTTSDGLEIPPKKKYSLDDMIYCIENAEVILSKAYKSDTINALRRKLEHAKTWKIFSSEGTPVSEISVSREISIIDLSFIDLDSVKALVTGLVARKIFDTRQAMYLASKLNKKVKETIPVTWIFIDEAHNFVAAEKVTPATPHLIKYAKEGRKLGCSMVLITQQPSATNNQILSQVDLMISHTLSNKSDITAFKARCPTKIPNEVDIDDALASLSTGTAIIASERHNRIFFSQIRPRLSKHAGKTSKPEIVNEKFDFDTVKSEERHFPEELPFTEEKEEHLEPIKPEESPEIKEEVKFEETKEFEPLAEEFTVEREEYPSEEVPEVKKDEFEEIIESIPPPLHVDAAPDLLADYAIRKIVLQEKDQLYRNPYVAKYKTVVFGYFKEILRAVLKVLKQYNFSFNRTYKLENVTVVRLKRNEDDVALIGLVPSAKAGFGLAIIFSTRRHLDIDEDSLFDEIDSEMSESEE
ncbi:MAG: DUF87 domain-containing protein [Candidatus Odinarchaeota archaeon]|nr:DUF87 domain-containing protein [Candidatus Odinarchaeota archaeon]